MRSLHIVRTTNHTGVYLKSAHCFVASPVEMDPSGQHSSGAAQRRKQRRMRSWWQHEQVSVAAAVATALHHCSQRGGGVARRPTGTEDSGNKGTRPGVLKDPEPQVLDAVVAYRAAGEPSVATPLLAAPAAEGIASSRLLRWRPEGGRRRRRRRR